MFKSSASPHTNPSLPRKQPVFLGWRGENQENEGVLHVVEAKNEEESE